ncbi:MAG: TetR/AcrR family transcriptional regulator [Deltaproteobacteria bacterium]|nr:TetR/AcrR family transcriptional regulator [Deltaproteobacteria bacterium]
MERSEWEANEDGVMEKKKQKQPTDFPMLKEQERENRRNLIIDAAERVFSAKPFEQVTMRNIAMEVGITPTAIYRYFADKQALYAESYVRSNNRLLEKLVKVFEHSSDLNLEKIATITVDHFLGEEQNLKMRAHFMIDDMLNDNLLGKLSENTKYFVDTIEQHFRKFSSDPEVRILALTFFAALNGVLLTYRKSPGKSRAEIVKNIRKEAQIVSEIFTKRLMSGGS